MSTLVQPYQEQAIAAEATRATVQVSVPGASPSYLSSLYRKQIQFLVEQLFFNERAPVHHIGLVGVDHSGETEHLCFDIAQVFADQRRNDIGLIDANPFSTPLESRLDLSAPEAPDSTWSIAPHLWFVPRKSWMSAGETFAGQSTAHLREFVAEFDFSILHCPPEPWLMARIGRVCEGLVLVLTAHKTRRLAAMRMAAQIQKMQIPLLGSVFSERRFPIPETIYQSL